MAGLGPQRMLSQLGRMGRDRAATGLLCAFMLLIEARSREPQWLSQAGPTCANSINDQWGPRAHGGGDGVAGAKGWGWWGRERRAVLHIHQV